MIKLLAYEISVGSLRDSGGGVNRDLIKKAEENLNSYIEDFESKGYEIQDIKVNHFTAKRHNNGGCEEVWVQYTIIYKKERENV